MSSLPNPALAQRLMNQLLTIIQSRNNATTIKRFKELLALDKVDNTSDIDKPISNSTIIAITTGDITGQRQTEKTWVQANASTAWIIPHNLQKRPNISILTPDGEEVFGDVTHLDVNTIRVEFSVPLTGSAFMS